MGYNVVHGSDSVESAQREIKIYFDENEIFSGKSAYDLTNEYLNVD
jgi:hypothetical protein